MPWRWISPGSFDVVLHGISSAKRRFFATGKGADMSDQVQPQDNSQLEGGQDPAGDTTLPADTGANENQPAGGSRTYTQAEVKAEVDKTVKARIDKQRKKHDAEIEALTASEQAALARAEEAEAKVKAFEESSARSALVASIAKEKNVDQDLLSKMTGTTEEEIAANADIIAAAIPKATYPDVPDKGGSGDSAASITKDAILAIKDPKERVRAIAANQHLFK